MPPSAAPRLPAPPPPPPLRAQSLGNCTECGPTEWAATAERIVQPGPGAAACADVAAATQPALAAMAGAATPDTASFAGPLTALVGEGDPTAGCGVVAVALPNGARYVGYRYEVFDGTSRGQCAADRPCTLAQARWTGHPKVERGGARTLVWGVFENGTTDRDRRARLTVFFVPPEGWTAPIGE